MAKGPDRRRLPVGQHHAGQRIDNFLLRELKGVPRPLVYRLLRKGSIRLAGGGKARPDQRLEAGDLILLPELARSCSDGSDPPLTPEPPVLHECADLIVFAKPAGLAVHGGSGIGSGLIERLRKSRGSDRIELAHRLDRDTSGALVVAKTRVGLLDFHRQLRAGRVRKAYVAVAFGKWRADMKVIEAPLRKLVPDGPGSRRARIDPAAGSSSVTRTRCRRQMRQAALLELILVTGRTHQARVHLAHVGMPIVGDRRYGDFAANRRAAAAGWRRMFLHAHSLRFLDPAGAPVRVSAPLPEDFSRVCAWLDEKN